MSVTGTVGVACPGCGADHECRLVQSINARTAPDDKQKLLAGELNVMACACGRRLQLAATVVFHDPDANALYQVCPGTEEELASAEQLMRAVGGTGARRVVPSLNALVEKIKLLDAGLDDRGVEMTKVLLLASRPQPDLDLVLLFEGVDREAGLLTWILFDPELRDAERLASPLAAYDRLAERAQREDGLRIDRAWAVEAVQRMIADAN